MPQITELQHSRAVRALLMIRDAYPCLERGKISCSECWSYKVSVSLFKGEAEYFRLEHHLPKDLTRVLPV